MNEQFLQDEVIQEKDEGIPVQKHFYYARLDEQKICCGLSDLSGEVVDSDLVLLDSYDVSLLGKKYEMGAWQDVPKEILPKIPQMVQTTNEELKKLVLSVQEQNLILMEAVAEMYEQKNGF